MSSKRSTPATKDRKASLTRGGPLPPYGVPIREAIAGGNLRNMKATAAKTRKYIAELERALRSLDGAIKKLGG